MCSPLDSVTRRAGGAGPWSAPLSWGQRFLAGCAGTFMGLGTVALCAERALGKAVAVLRAGLAAGGALDAEGARALLRLTALVELSAPLASFPPVALGAALLALCAGLCALASRVCRGGGHFLWLGASFAAPCLVALALWYAAPWLRDAAPGAVSPGVALAARPCPAGGGPRCTCALLVSITDHRTRS